MTESEKVQKLENHHRKQAETKKYPADREVLERKAEDLKIKRRKLNIESQLHNEEPSTSATLPL